MENIKFMEKIKDFVKEQWFDTSYDISVNDFALGTEIVDTYLTGDWKHSHARLNYLITVFADKNGYTVYNRIDTTFEDREEDWYTAEHKYYLVPNENVPQMNEIRKLFED